MYTDEYQISLSRELSVSKKAIARIEKFLIKMENRYGLKTDDFLKEFSTGKPTEQNKDFITWVDYGESLKSWRNRLQQYEEMFRIMKN